MNLTTVLTSLNIEALPEFLLAMAGHASVRVVNLDLVRDPGPGRGGGDYRPLWSRSNPWFRACWKPWPLSTPAAGHRSRCARWSRPKSAPRDHVAQPYCLACEGRYAALTPEGDLFSCSSFTAGPCPQAGQPGGWGRYPIARPQPRLGPAAGMPGLRSPFGLPGRLPGQAHRRPRGRPAVKATWSVRSAGPFTKE